MFCTKCGKRIADASRFCHFCGQPMPVRPKQVPRAAAPQAEPLDSAPPATLIEELSHMIKKEETAPAEPPVVEPPAAPVPENEAQEETKKEEPKREEPEKEEPVQPAPVEEPAPEAPVSPEPKAEEPMAPAPAAIELNGTTVLGAGDAALLNASQAPMTPPVAVATVLNTSRAPVPPVVPMAPTYAPNPTYAPAPVPVAPIPHTYAPPAAPQPTPKKGMPTWLRSALAALAVTLLIVGGVLGYFLFNGFEVEESLDALTVVAFDGDFAQVEALAPTEYWTAVEKKTTPAKLMRQGSTWKFDVLPAALQGMVDTAIGIQCDSFLMPSRIDVISEADVSATERQMVLAQAATYGISATRVDEMRRLEVEMAITGKTGGVETPIRHRETMYVVEIDGVLYLTDETGTFAVDTIVKAMEKVK